MRNYIPQTDTDIDFDKLVEIADPKTKVIPSIPLKLRDDAKRKPKQVIKPAENAGRKSPPSADEKASASEKSQPSADEKPSGSKSNISQPLKRFKSPHSKSGASTVTVFAQILTYVKLINFKKIVAKFKSDKYSKSFNSWSHLVTMIFAQLSGASSLRELVYGLNLAAGSLFQLGMRKPPSRSNLSDINSKRPWTFFKDVFMELQHQLTSLMNITGGFRKKFKFKNKLFSLDSSIISLSLEVYDWVKYKATKGAVKLHCLLDHDTYLPYFAVITPGKKADITIAQSINFPKEAIIVMDRGYVKFDFFYKLTTQGTYFVSRIKDNVLFKVIKSIPVPNPPGRPKQFEDYSTDSAKPHVTRDEYIVLTMPKSTDAYPDKLRLVTAIVKDERTHELMQMSFITNIFHLSASTIAAIYKDRWAIESFFRKIKQNLKIKTFLGTSRNAVHIQIWTALITVLLLEYLKYLSKINWHISHLAYVIRLSLHTYVNLNELIDKPERFNELYNAQHDDPDEFVLRPLF
ncbi:MAG: IS4 family transposase [Deltaproteobacteria bacterium]|jgi:hypothetical protein|nr:IS4 family transposase [Deltaproteobacteria bacterium]